MVDLPSRSPFGKLNSVDLYRQLIAENKFSFPELPAPLLSIATDKVTAKEAAFAIYSKLESIKI